VVELCQEKAELYGYEDEPNDCLLDKYEHGMTAADVRVLFDAAKGELVPLRQTISENGVVVDDSLVYQPYDVSGQKEIAR
jgi:carboxypeptidase Taq